MLGFRMFFERIKYFNSSIKKATLADAPAIVELVNSAYRGETSKKGWTTEADFLGGQRTDMREIEAIIKDSKSVILLMFSAQNNISACVHLEKISLKKAYLGMLTVNPTSQQGGIGKALLKTAEVFVHESWQVQEIEMTVISLRKELISWYERRGYHLTGERKTFPMHDPRFGLPKRDDLEFVVLVKSL